MEIRTIGTHNTVIIENKGSGANVYYKVDVINNTATTLLTSFTVTKGELDNIITALVMLKDELNKGSVPNLQV